jgi:hypothetical protein
MADDADAPEIITLQEARERDLDFYFTGNPCPNGHVAQRRVKWRSCVACEALQVAKYRLAHPADAKATNDRCRAARNARDPDYNSSPA